MKQRLTHKTTVARLLEHAEHHESKKLKSGELVVDGRLLGPICIPGRRQHGPEYRDCGADAGPREHSEEQQVGYRQVVGARCRAAVVETSSVDDGCAYLQELLGRRQKKKNNVKRKTKNKRVPTFLSDITSANTHVVEDELCFSEAPQGGPYCVWRSIRVVYGRRKGARSSPDFLHGLVTSEATEKEGFTVKVFEQRPTRVLHRGE